jgi:hypothetical protein
VPDSDFRSDMLDIIARSARDAGREPWADEDR